MSTIDCMVGMTKDANSLESQRAAFQEIVERHLREVLPDADLQRLRAVAPLLMKK